MRFCTSISPIGLAPLVLLASALVSMAAETPEGAPEHGGGAVMTLVFSFINFSIFLILLRRYAWPAVSDFLTSRRKEVSEAMAAAEQAKQEADSIRREYAAKEAALEETRRRMLDEIRQSASADRERALEDAKSAAARLRAEAERQADHDLARARRELRAEAAKLAAGLAEQKIPLRLTDHDRARLVREFVEGVTKP